MYTSKYSECVGTIEGSKFSKKCKYVEFSNHRQHSRRSVCGHFLLKEITLPCGKKKLVPWYTYCYKSLKESLQECVYRPEFERKCELWRNRSNVNDCFSDIYDGKIWKEMCDINGENVLIYQTIMVLF